MNHAHTPSRGFTLLEVMVAVAILGLGLTAILSAQAGSFAAASHARNISVATGLLRCKMTEVEEQLGRLGFQELDQTESGPCCEGDDTPNMKCTWKIEKPVLPEGKFGDLKLDAALNGGPAGSLGSLLGGAPAGSGALPSLGPDAKLGDVAGALGGLMSGAPPAGGSPTPGAPGTPDLGAAAAGGIGGIASMVMGLVYPSLKILFEASTRRVTVTLNWREGKKDYSMEIQQWITNPQNVSGSDDTDDGGAPSLTSTGAGGTNPPRIPRTP